MAQSLFTLPSSSEPFTGLMASLSGGNTGGMIPIITPTGTTHGGTGIGGIIGITVMPGIPGTPGFIAGSTGTTGGTGLHGGLSNKVRFNYYILLSLVGKGGQKWLLRNGYSWD